MSRAFSFACHKWMSCLISDMTTQECVAGMHARHGTQADMFWLTLSRMCFEQRLGLQLSMQHKAQSADYLRCLSL